MNRVMLAIAVLLVVGAVWMQVSPPQRATAAPADPLPEVAVSIEDNAVVVRGTRFTGAIFNEAAVQKERAVYSFLPHDRPVEFWTPTSWDIARVERRLARTMESMLTDSDARIEKNLTRYEWRAGGDTAYVATNLAKSCRQYVGFTVDGHRYILLNCFPLDDPWLGNWRHGIAMVADGGADFWRIIYDVEQDRCEDFDCNGTA
jgi:hypothetical protein